MGDPVSLPPGFVQDGPPSGFVLDSQTEKPSAASRFASNAWEGANPVSLLSGMGESILHPLQAIKGYLKQNSDLADKVEAALKRGDHGQALKHFGDLALQVIPGLGAQSDAAGEQVSAGDVAGGLGKSTGAALGVVEASALPKIARGAAEAIHAVPGAAATVGRVVTNPEVIRKGVKVLPKGGAMIEAYDTIKKAAAQPEEAPQSAPLPAQPRPQPIQGPSVRPVEPAAALLTPAEIAALPAHEAQAYLDANLARRQAGIVTPPPRPEPSWRGFSNHAPPRAETLTPAQFAALSTQEAKDYLAANLARRRPIAGQPSPEMLRQAGIPLSAEEQALASEILAGVEPQEAAGATSVPRETVAPQGPIAPPAADFESIPLQGPAQGNVIPIRPSGNPIQPGISLPGGQGAAIPPEVPGLDAQRAFAEAMTGDPSGGQIPAPASPHPPAEAFEAAYRAKRAQVLADHFHANGISYEDLQHLTPGDLSSEQWEALLGKDPDTGVQFREPSQETIDQARVFLAGKSAAARSPKALAAAKELAKPEAAPLMTNDASARLTATVPDQEFTAAAKGLGFEVAGPSPSGSFLIKEPSGKAWLVGKPQGRSGRTIAPSVWSDTNLEAMNRKGQAPTEAPAAPSIPEPKPKARAKAKTKKISDLMNDTGGK